MNSWEQIGEDVFGNALGNAIGDPIADKIRNAETTPKPVQAPIEIDPGEPGVQVQDINAPLAPISLANLTYTVQKGDSLSGIMGSSDLATVQNNGSVSGGFRYGDHEAQVELLSGDSPGTIFDTVSQSDPLFGGTFNIATGSYDDPLRSLFAQYTGQTVYHSAVPFDPTADPVLPLAPDVNQAVLARLRRYPAVIAELDEGEANGVSVTVASPGGKYNIQQHTIELPEDEIGNPDLIVETLLHEAGHMMWGDVSIPTSQVLTMSEQQYVSQQLPLQLQNEGVATINAIAGAEAIWGDPLIAPDNAYVIHYYVDGAVVPNPLVDATAKFQSGYQDFLNGSGMSALMQGANEIGKFYGPNEVLGSNTNETYNQYYVHLDQQQFEGD